MEADPCGPGARQRGVTVVELGQVRPRGLEGAGLVVEHGRELELGQDLGVPRIPPYVVRKCDGLVYQGGRRVRVASCQQQLRARRVPAPRWTRAGRARSSSSSRCSASSRRPRHRSAPSAAPPHKVAWTGSPEGHALLEALTGDGQATIDLPGLHVLHGGASRARCPTMPAVRPRASARSCPASAVADVAEVEAGEGSRGQSGLQLRLRRSPRSWRRRWLVARLRRLAAKWACRFRYSDWAFRARASSSVGESPAYSMASRIASCFPIASPWRREATNAE